MIALHTYLSMFVPCHYKCAILHSLQCMMSVDLLMVVLAALLQRLPTSSTPVYVMLCLITCVVVSIVHAIFDKMMYSYKFDEKFMKRLQRYQSRSASMFGESFGRSNSVWGADSTYGGEKPLSAGGISKDALEALDDVHFDQKELSRAPRPQGRAHRIDSLYIRPEEFEGDANDAPSVSDGADLDLGEDLAFVGLYRPSDTGSQRSGGHHHEHKESQRKGHGFRGASPLTKKRGNRPRLTITDPDSVPASLAASQNSANEGRSGYRQEEYPGDDDDESYDDNGDEEEGSEEDAPSPQGRHRGYSNYRMDDESDDDAAEDDDGAFDDAENAMFLYGQLAGELDDFHASSSPAPSPKAKQKKPKEQQPKIKQRLATPQTDTVSSGNKEESVGNDDDDVPMKPIWKSQARKEDSDDDELFGPRRAAGPILNKKFSFGARGDDEDSIDPLDTHTKELGDKPRVWAPIIAYNIRTGTLTVMVIAGALLGQWYIMASLNTVAGSSSCDMYPTFLYLTIGFHCFVFEPVVMALTYLHRVLSSDEYDDFFSELHPYSGDLRDSGPAM